MPRKRAAVKDGMLQLGAGGGALTMPALRQLGTNMADNVYYNPARPFTNQARLIAHYVVGDSSTFTWDTGGTVQTNSNGFPINFTAPVVCNTVLDMYAGHPNGTWTLTWDGPANAMTVDSATNSSNSCVFTKTTGYQRFVVRFRAGGVTAVRCYHSSDNQSDVFTPAFIDKCKNFKILRLMNWCNPNYVWTPDWATRTTPASYSQARKSATVVGYAEAQQQGGMAWEYVAQLANAADRDIWVCIHHLSTDSYVEQVAKFLHANINPGRRVYVEFSNETWNSQFPVHAYCQAMAPEGDPDILRRGYIYAMDRGAAIGRIFKNNMPGRVVKTVWGVQSAGGTGFLTYSVAWIKAATMDEIDVFSPAPYFGNYAASTNALRDAIHNAWLTSQSAAVNEVFSQINTHLAASDGPYQQMTDWKTMANLYGKQLIAYEGGQHLMIRGVDQNSYATSVGQAFILANRDPRMATLYTNYLNEWHTRTGGDIMCHYTDVYDPQQKFGSWGLQEYEGESTATALKWGRALDFLASQQ